MSRIEETLAALESVIIGVETAADLIGTAGAAALVLAVGAAAVAAGAKVTVKAVLLAAGVVGIVSAVAQAVKNFKRKAEERDSIAVATSFVGYEVAKGVAFTAVALAGVSGVTSAPIARVIMAALPESIGFGEKAVVTETVATFGAATAVTKASSVRATAIEAALMPVGMALITLYFTGGVLKVASFVEREYAAIVRTVQETLPACLL